jgi:hypothetical protein
MNRIIRVAALGLAAAVATSSAVLTAPSVAAARGSSAPDGAISALADLALLAGNPWRPGADTDVVVRNDGPVDARGFFLLTLPEGVELGATDGCDTIPAGGDQTWVCGGDRISAGGSRTYPIRVNAQAEPPEFGVQRYGYVTGRDEQGRLGRRTGFRITWPDRTELRLTAAKGSIADGAAKVAVRVSNAGSFPIGGYSLVVETDTGMRVISKGCASVGADPGPCRIDRNAMLEAGATDRFTVTLAPAPGDRPQSVHLLLTPSDRYTNPDTTATLTWKGAPAVSPSHARPSPAAEPGPAGGTPDTSAGSSPDSADDSTAGGSGGGAGGATVTAPAAASSRLRADAAEVSFLVAGGSALLGVAVLIFLLPRRRSATR